MSKANVQLDVNGRATVSAGGLKTARVQFGVDNDVVDANAGNKLHTVNTEGDTADFQSQIDHFVQQAQGYEKRISMLYEFDRKTGRRVLKKGAQPDLDRLQTMLTQARQSALDVQERGEQVIVERRAAKSQGNTEVAAELAAHEEAAQLRQTNEVRARAGLAPVTGLAIK